MNELQLGRLFIYWQDTEANRLDWHELELITFP